jgi:hypothetical protein
MDQIQVECGNLRIAAKYAVSVPARATEADFARVVMAMLRYRAGLSTAWVAPVREFSAQRLSVRTETPKRVASKANELFILRGRIKTYQRKVNLYTTLLARAEKKYKQAQKKLLTEEPSQLSDRDFAELVRQRRNINGDS